MYVIYSSLIDLARKFQGFSIKFCKMADDGGAEGSDTVSDANNQVLKPNMLKAKLKNDTVEEDRSELPSFYKTLKDVEEAIQNFEVATGTKFVYFTLVFFYIKISCCRDATNFDQNRVPLSICAFEYQISSHDKSIN